jgi:hypothetical protein
MVCGKTEVRLVAAAKAQDAEHGRFTLAKVTRLVNVERRMRCATFGAKKRSASDTGSRCPTAD